MKQYCVVETEDKFSIVDAKPDHYGGNTWRVLIKRPGNWFWRTYKVCNEAESWIDGYNRNRDEAVAIANQLLRLGYYTKQTSCVKEVRGCVEPTSPWPHTDTSVAERPIGGCVGGTYVDF